MNVSAGVDATLSFWYSSAIPLADAVKAYSGLNGSGTLLGSFSMLGNSPGAYDTWTQATFSFAGTAQSFDFTGASGAGIDNISAVPEVQSYAMMLAGLGAVGLIARRKKSLQR